MTWFRLRVGVAYKLYAHLLVLHTKCTHVHAYAGGLDLAGGVALLAHAHQVGHVEAPRLPQVQLQVALLVDAIRNDNPLSAKRLSRYLLPHGLMTRCGIHESSPNSGREPALTDPWGVYDDLPHWM
jgi:hypothetical protein